jgi:glucose-1-phosphate adenylyltransferase
VGGGVKRTVVFILAGGAGKRLSLLTRYRAKPAVPFAGRYRIIDFTLTNCMRSGIDSIYLLTQYISRSIIRHVGIGKPWDLDRASGGIRSLHPHLGFQAADWYQGTADAIYQNLSVLRESDCKNVLILSGDHVYQMDYRDFEDFHEKAGKPATLGVVEVSPSLCREFGIATIDSKGSIRRFEEKPDRTKSNLASMGIYLFQKDFLIATLERLKKSITELDFGMHVIPYLVKRGKLSAYRFDDFWLDIGTLKSYYTASLSLLAKRPRLSLYDESKPVITVPDDNPPLVVSGDARIERSLVCNGCVVNGTVNSTILSPGVVIERGATVDGSVLFHDCIVRKGAVVKNVVMDKAVVIGAGSVVGDGDATVANEMVPDYLDFGLTVVGRKTSIPAGIKIGTNCLVCGPQDGRSIPRRDIGDGGYRVFDEIQS